VPDMRCGVALALALLGAVAACGNDDPTRTGVGPTAAAPASRHDEVSGEFASAIWPAEGEPRRGGRLVIALVADVDSFNPYLSTTAYAREVFHWLWPYVLDEEPDFHAGPSTMRPGLVDRWEVDGTKVRMHLRDGLVWSDGTPITTRDVAFSLEAAKHPAVAWVNRQIVDFIDRVEIVDAQTYVLHFSQRYLYVEKDAKDWRILPAHVFGAVPFAEWKGHDWEEAAKTAVSGPYRLESHAHGQELTFVPNERYWRHVEGLPRLERVIVRVIRQKQGMIDSLLAGEVDAIDQVRPEDARRVLDDPRLLLFNFAGLIYEYVGWNCESPLFADPRVRLAMTLAIDRANIVESELAGYGKLMAGPFPSSTWAIDRDLAPHPHDPGRAKELLAAAGWHAGADGVLQKEGRPFAFVLSVAEGRPRRLRVAQLVQAELRRIGVTITLQPLDFNTMSEFLREGKADAWIGGWWLSTKPDAKAFFHSETARYGGFNFGRYKNADADALIDAARAEPDLGRAKELWKRFQAIFSAEQPYTLLYEQRMLNAVDRRFRGVRQTALNTYDNLHEWFVPE